MTTFAAAEAALLVEVGRRLASLALDLYSTIPLQRYQGQAEEQATLNNALIGERQYSISPGRRVGTHGFGHSYSLPLYEYDITIQYPAGDKWARAMHSDALLIYRDLLNHSPSVSGVQARQIKPDTNTETSRDDKGDKQEMTLTLLVYYEVTG
jgi:hypothetical protein